MVPAVYNFPKLYEGDTHDGLSITVETTTGGVSSPVDLTNVDIAMQVRSNSAGALALDLSVGSGITKTDATNGVFRVDAFTVPAAGLYDYDIEFTYADGTVKTYMGGAMSVKADVTA